MADTDLSMLDSAGDDAYTLADELANVDTENMAEVVRYMPGVIYRLKRINESVAEVLGVLESHGHTFDG